MGIHHKQLNRLFAGRYAQIHERLVALQPVVVADRIGHRLHEYLRAIDLNTILSKVEESDKCVAGDVFAADQIMKKRYAAYPFVLDNAVALLDSCSTADYRFGRLNKQTFTGSKKSDLALLSKLALEGLQYRYGRDHKEALKRVKYELKVIDELDFCTYFLITWDFIRYSMSRGTTMLDVAQGPTAS